MTDELIKTLLEAGVHFGHQTKRWNPKMKKYIFGERSGIYIIDLEKTAAHVVRACNFIRGISSSGAPVLLVGTKPQAQGIIQEEAKRCFSPPDKRKPLSPTTVLYPSGILMTN